MNVLLEQVYSIFEASLVAGFMVVYFERKLKISKILCFCISTALLYIISAVITSLNASWLITTLLLVPLIVSVSRIFYSGKLWEHILISVIINTILSLSSLCVVTFMSKVLSVEYAKLIGESDFARFLTVMIAQTVRLIAFSIIIVFKKKYSFILQKKEYLLISTTLLISTVLIILVRNIIYKTNENYNIFLIAVLSLLLLNVAQFYILIHIAQRNKEVLYMSVMKKQIEMQEKSIKLLEEKYDETAKIRHDMKHYISSAISLAENGSREQLINYLKNISEEKIDNIKTYVQTKRSVLGAVINSKLSTAQKKGFKMQCSILSELDNISDTDLGVLLGNLLDNAIEACEKNKGTSEIYIKTWAEAGYYLIEIRNTVDTDVLAENPDLNTSKSDKKLHGIGLKSIRDTIEKYNGILNFAQKIDCFFVHISLCKEKYISNLCSL